MNTSGDQDIFNIFQDKYKINIYLDGKYPHDPGGTTIYQLRNCLEKLYGNITILFNASEGGMIAFITVFRVG